MKQEIYFNKNLKYLTSNTIITQSELSRILGISRQAVFNLINKNADVRLSTITKIADVIYASETKDINASDEKDPFNGI